MRLPGFFAMAVLMAIPMAGMSEVIFSEIVEGTLSFKYIEIVNRGETTVDLTSPPITLRRYINGASSPSLSSLTGTLAPGEFLVLTNDLGVYKDYLSTAPTPLLDRNIMHTGDDSYELFDGTNVIDTFAGDWIGGGDPGNPAADGVFYRVLSALPNNGHWGGKSSNPIPDGADSPSGYWTRREMTLSNGNAAAICTPFSSGGAGGREVPVAVSAFAIE